MVSNYRYWPSCDQLGYPMVVMFASSIQRAVTRLNSISFWESMVMAAMYLPSGDQCGDLLIEQLQPFQLQREQLPVHRLRAATL